MKHTEKTKELLRVIRTTHGHSRMLPGKKPTRTFECWRHMLERCRSPQHKSFYRYGGRGINVCERWLKFENFLSDMGEKPEGYTLGRVDNDRGYEMENCRWETHKEQANNRRNSRVISFNGKDATISQWAEQIGMGHDTFCRRMKLGWSMEEIISIPLKKQKNSRPVYKLRGQHG